MDISQSTGFRPKIAGSLKTNSNASLPSNVLSKLDVRTRIPVQYPRPSDIAVSDRKRQIEVVDLTNGIDDEDHLKVQSPALKRSRSSTSSDSTASTGSHSDSDDDVQPFVPRRALGTPVLSRSGESSPDLVGSSSKGSRRSKEIAIAVKVPAKPRTEAEQERHRQFERNLGTLSGVSVVNEIDSDLPPSNFKFILNNVLGKDVERASEDVLLGCDCQKRYKQQFGCVYLTCSCIEDSATDNNGRKSFPYGASENNYRCLRPKILNTRNHIYECNSRCDCTMNCKNRVVQHGRQVKLQIFKTSNRGWGLKCLENLQQGQFIDTYRGEIITSEEADRRGKELTEDEANFLFDFDKFVDETAVYDAKRAYVCDGRYMGSPTRFLNHSCEPNCRLFTVSYNHNDRNIYELAFFALTDIPRGTELTFDYYDEEEPVVISDERAREFEAEKGYRPTKCLCGNENCRRYFFT